MDGKVDSYVPPAELSIASRLRLHAAVDEELDPVTYEVIRHNLWTINEEHGDAIVRVSGSPIAAYGYDFNPSILDEHGDFVYFGPYLQFHSGMQDVQAKWILEYRSENPGIEPGDMFMSNDPWVGTTHQNDVMLCCPVFVGEELFCWVANTLHFVDLGGTMPGGWNPVSESVYAESPLYPPIKIVEAGELRRDIEEQFLRQSRLPQSVALDLRAVIAGNSVARARILELVERYGAGTVKSVMRRIVDDSAVQFRRRIEAVPDGVWSERGYLESAVPGDRQMYKGELHLRKAGDRLTFTNRGTDPSVGSLNITYAAWRGGILSVLNPFLCPDSLYAIGGPLRHIEFEPQPGSLTSASHPAAVANGGAIGTEFSISLANNCIAKLAHTVPELRRFYTANGGITQWPLDSITGLDQRGNHFQNQILDWFAAPIGAYSFRDGIDTGGIYWGPKQIAPNVEQNEKSMPVLYLHRCELPDSGGAGTQVGGSTMSIAFTVYGSEELVHQIAACGVSHPTGTGLFGGYPGPPSVFLFRAAAAGESVRDVLAAPGAGDPVEAGEGVRRVPPKESGLLQRPGDVLEVSCSGSAGLGDPLDRDPASVAADVASGRWSDATATELFGVVFAPGDGVPPRVDEEETAGRRERLRAERLRRAEPPRRSVEAPDRLREPRLELGPGLDVREDSGGRSWYCSARSGRALAPLGDPYKESCPLLVLPVSAAGPRFGDPAEFVDELVELRLFLCPDSGGLIEAEVAREKDPPLADVDLTPAAAGRL